MKTSAGPIEYQPWPKTMTIRRMWRRPSATFTRCPASSGAEHARAARARGGSRYSIGTSTSIVGAVKPGADLELDPQREDVGGDEHDERPGLGAGASAGERDAERDDDEQAGGERLGAALAAARRLEQARARALQLLLESGSEPMSVAGAGMAGGRSSVPLSAPTGHG